MLIPDQPAEAEIEIKRSRFFSQTCHLADQNQVKSIIMAKKNMYHDASHIVWAYCLGKDGDIFGYNDDREPKSTAGRPTYEVLKGSGIVHILLTTVRYFGGTKLGTGGLVRAYTAAAKAVLEKTKVKTLIDELHFELKMNYQEYKVIKNILLEWSANIDSEIFLDSVVIKGKIPEKNRLNCNKKLQDYSRGKLQI